MFIAVFEMVMDRVIVYKIGGNVVDNPKALHRFLEGFAAITGRKVLVHGGGKIASNIGLALGIKPQMIDGRRVTDSETLKVVTMVYGGLVNKTVVAQLQGIGCSAIGLSGVDGALIRSKRRASTPIDFGEVGDPVSVNVELLSTLLDAGFVPVIAPITLSESSSLLNTNADTVAQSIAVGLSSTYEAELRYIFEKEGVLDKNDTLIGAIDPKRFEELKMSTEVSGGMIPKIDNALIAINQGVSLVYIGETEIRK